MCSPLQIQQQQKPCHWLSARKKIPDKLTADVSSAGTDLAGSELMMLLSLRGLWCLILHVCKWWCVGQTGGEVGSQDWSLWAGFTSVCLQMPKRWGSTVERASAAEGKKTLSEVTLFTSDWSILGVDKFLVLFLTDGKKNADNPFRWKNLYLSIFIFNCTCVPAASLTTMPITNSWGFESLCDISARKKIPASI